MQFNVPTEEDSRREWAAMSSRGWTKRRVLGADDIHYCPVHRPEPLSMVFSDEVMEVLDQVTKSMSTIPADQRPLVVLRPPRVRSCLGCDRVEFTNGAVVIHSADDDYYLAAPLPEGQSGGDHRDASARRGASADPEPAMGELLQLLVGLEKDLGSDHLADLLHTYAPNWKIPSLRASEGPNPGLDGPGQDDNAAERLASRTEPVTTIEPFGERTPPPGYRVRMYGTRPLPWEVHIFFSGLWVGINAHFADEALALAACRAHRYAVLASLMPTAAGQEARERKDERLTREHADQKKGWERQIAGAKTRAKDANALADRLACVAQKAQDELAAALGRGGAGRSVEWRALARAAVAFGRAHPGGEPVELSNDGAPATRGWEWAVPPGPMVDVTFECPRDVWERLIQVRSEGQTVEALILRQVQSALNRAQAATNRDRKRQHEQPRSSGTMGERADIRPKSSPVAQRLARQCRLVNPSVLELLTAIEARVTGWSDDVVTDEGGSR